MLAGGGEKTNPDGVAARQGMSVSREVNRVLAPLPEEG